MTFLEVIATRSRTEFYISQYNGEGCVMYGTGEMHVELIHGGLDMEVYYIRSTKWHYLSNQ